jgi:hypothetical protein
VESWDIPGVKMQTSWHMFSDFFLSKPVAKLLAKDIEAHPFNGRCT